MVEVIREKAFSIHLDALDFDAKWECGLDRRGEGVFLAKDPVAPRTKGAEGHFEGAGAASSEAALPVTANPLISPVALRKAGF